MTKPAAAKKSRKKKLEDARLSSIVQLCGERGPVQVAELLPAYFWVFRLYFEAWKIENLPVLKDCVVYDRVNGDYFQFQLRFLHGLLLRSESNKARIQNEITLAFHSAAQRNSSIQVRIGEEAIKETTAIKAIAVVTITFLPATFVVSILVCYFSTWSPLKVARRSILSSLISSRCTGSLTLLAQQGAIWDEVCVFTEPRHAAYFGGVKRGYPAMSSEACRLNNYLNMCGGKKAAYFERIAH
ncbi:hypothetical protein K469DRAFT_697945 [Zopfia rhizophila CBS 207.26]|uniref:Uncharacterized protein n=1 Tax=Zopfia rhizophila CBS 207.26 TaxID=1314779 RepID=A0A6A6EIK1_9PEZI|nr:hypothetical protein K469DRAFT_697945 [Zopfia rhizophila CBS 207.26]